MEDAGMLSSVLAWVMVQDSAVHQDGGDRGEAHFSFLLLVENQVQMLSRIDTKSKLGCFLQSSEEDTDLV